MKIGLLGITSRICYAPDGMGGEGGNNQNVNQNNNNNNQQQQQQMQNNNNNNGGENNNGNNDVIFQNMWEDEQNDNNNNRNNNNNNNNNRPTPENVPNASEQFDTYIKGLDFTKGVDLNQVQQDLSQGKIDSLADAMKTAGANAYRHAIMDAQKLIKDNVDRAVTSAVSKSRGIMHASEALREMNTKHTYTKDPAIAPVAEGVLKRFMEKGQNLETAIANTHRYFERTTQLVGGNKGRMRGNGFGNNPNNGNNFNDDHGGEGDEALDFMNILSENAGQA